MSTLNTFLNPVEWFRAHKFHKQNAHFDKSEYDLELYLYGKMLKNNMLHYGYFEDTNIDPNNISLKMVEDAQENYASKIIEQIKDKQNIILDVGCGMGGLAKMIHDKGMKVEALTPNRNQIDFINKHQPYLTTHHCRFEEYKGESKVGTVINSESLQYIPLSDAFDIVDRILLPNGQWIIVDYFRLHNGGVNKSSHLFEDFQQQIKASNWKIAYEQDITTNVLPTLKFIDSYVQRVVMPLKHFAYEKLRFKQAWLYYLTGKMRDAIENKMSREHAAIDPDKFVKEKRYMLYVLEKRRH